LKETEGRKLKFKVIPVPCLELSAFGRFWLEIDPCTQLKRPRAARAEHLGHPGSRLPERGAGEIAAVPREVRGVVQVEHLADQGQAPALSKHERPVQAQIERLKIVAEGISGRKSQKRNKVAVAALRPSIGLLKLARNRMPATALERRAFCAWI
jgi:hypothetical protein